MAISAFGPQGRLKKNALRGTALGSDPSMVLQRGQFRELYDEARGGGFNRTQMQERLSGRTQNLQAQTQSRLARIAEQGRGLQAEASAAPDLAMERNFSAYEQGVLLPEYREKSNQVWDEGQPTYERRGRVAARQTGQTGEEVSNYFASVPGSKNQSPQQMKQGFAEYGWEKYAGFGASKKYKEKLSSKYRALNERQSALNRETAQNRQNLASRTELYNMFLG